MKCVQLENGPVERVDDKQAAYLVDEQGWHYTSKGAYKAQKHATVPRHGKGNNNQPPMRAEVVREDDNGNKFVSLIGDVGLDHRNSKDYNKVCACGERKDWSCQKNGCALKDIEEPETGFLKD